MNEKKFIIQKGLQKLKDINMKEQYVKKTIILGTICFLECILESFNLLNLYLIYRI